MEGTYKSKDLKSNGYRVFQTRTEFKSTVVFTELTSFIQSSVNALNFI